MIILILLAIAAIFPYTIGLLTLVYLFKGKKTPMDTSNRINHIRLWWFVLTRPELFVSTFDWLRHDELDNMKGK